MNDNILTKNEIKEIFHSDEYKDFNVLLVTSDKKVFKNSNPNKEIQPIIIVYD